MIPEHQKDCLKATFCCCVKPSRAGHELFDDDRFVTSPEFVGTHILFWGKKNSRFPYQCFVGPDWPVVMMTYGLIIGVNVIVLSIIAPVGWPLVLIGVCTCLILLYFYSATVASDSGIIFKQYVPASSSGDEPLSSSEMPAISFESTASNEDGAGHSQTSGDIESGQGETKLRGESDDACDSTRQLIESDRVSVEQTLMASAAASFNGSAGSSSSPSGSATVHPSNGFVEYNDQGAPAPPTLTNRMPMMTVEPHIPAVPATIECGQCDLQRPYSARHCTYCKACIDNLDHHCPWCGKCIGEKNIKQFYCFVGWLQFQMYYLFGVFIYFIVTSSTYK